MMPPWMIEKLREENIAQQKRDRASWDEALRIEVDDPVRHPPAKDGGDGRTDGGIVTVNFSI